MTSPPTGDIGTFCPQVNLGPATGFGRGDRRAQIKVDAPAHSHWTLAIRETYGQPSTAPPAVQQLPMRRSGVGPAFLGTFTVREGLYVKAACVGTGTLVVTFGGAEDSGPCPNSWQKVAMRGALAGGNGPSPERVRFYIRAPAGMKWTIIAFDGPDPTRHTGANVW